jgi:hypothetical protein
MERGAVVEFGDGVAVSYTPYMPPASQVFC